MTVALDGPTTMIEMLRKRLQEDRRNSRIPSDWQVAVESCGLVILALRNHRGPEYMSAMRALLDSRNRDGSWPAFSGDDPSGSWATAIAVFALVTAQYPRPDWERGLVWLLNARGQEASWLWRWKFQHIDKSARFDPRKYGWSWIPGTTSWVIPTSFSLIALQSARLAGLRCDLLNDRIELGMSMLLDRMCPGGGWNAGNGVAFGVALAPYIDATAIALLALQSHECEAVDASLRWLRRRLLDCPSPYSLAWGILALAAYARKGFEFGYSLEEASSRLTTAITQAGCFLDTTTLAISTLALSAIDGDDVFAVQP